MLPFVFGALGLAVGAVTGAFATHAAGEKDRQAANHHKQVANELTNNYTNLEKKYHEFTENSKKQIDDLTRQNLLNEIEKDTLRLAVRLQQNVIYLMWEIGREPTADVLEMFQVAVEQTNQVLQQLKEELIIVPNDYYTNLFQIIELGKSSKQEVVDTDSNIFSIDSGSISTKDCVIPMNRVAATPLNAVTKPSTISGGKTILSVDLGRTSTKICVSRDPNSVVFIPPNVKELPIECFEAGATDSLMDLWIQPQNHINGYAIGQLAADFGANLGVGQSKVEDALVKVLASAGYLKLKDEVAVVLSLPFLCQEQFEHEKAQLTRLLTGPHVFNFRGESMSLNFSKVWIMPDGYGSLLWSEAQPYKGATVPDFSKILVAVVDIGHQTIDFLMVDNFRFYRHLSKSEEFGMSKFYELIAKEIEGADSQSLALISAVNKPKGDRYYRPKGASKPTNLDDFLPNLIEMFSRDICSRILAWLPERVTDVILTGGGGEFFWEDVQRLLKEARINAYLAAPSRQANALGQFIYGEAHLTRVRAARS